ncbi:MAG: type II secretion system protein [Elusimicrobiaceae bacterium]|nr:type II secretion system protein [Elusimicrobiaceae bacterium]
MNQTTKAGFTLIELLVVVLIISILAAVAVPQYKKSKDRSIIAKMKTSVKQLHDAQQIYFLENGKYTKDLPDLAIGFPSQTRNFTVVDSTEMCGTGSKCRAFTVADMGDYEVGLGMCSGGGIGTLQQTITAQACFKDKCACIGRVANPVGQWPELYGRTYCWTGKGVPGYGSRWSNADWCSKTFSVSGKDQDRQFNGGSYTMIAID